MAADVSRLSTPERSSEAHRPITDVDVVYHPRRRTGGSRIGAHASRAVGSLGTFRDQVPFMSYPDARRIDLRATLRDPFENTFVRRFHQRMAVDVVLLADLSGSLDYEGESYKKDLIVALAGALARSATRIGDRFALFGCDGGIREDCTVYPTKRPGIVPEVVGKLERAACTGPSAAGLLEAVGRVSGTGKIVFVASDFLLPLDLIRSIFEGLAQHDVIPVMISDSSEDRDLPDWGLVELADLESGRRRLVVMRPSLKKAWLDGRAGHRRDVDTLARQFGRAPVIVTDRFDADDFSRQLAEA